MALIERRNLSIALLYQDINRTLNPFRVIAFLLPAWENILALESFAYAMVRPNSPYPDRVLQ